MPTDSTLVGQYAPPVGVLLLFQNRMFAEAMAVRLRREPRLEILPIATTLAHARQAATGRDVHLILADVRPARELGVLRQIGALPQPAQVVLLAGEEDEPHAVASIRAGVRGWVGRSDTVEHLLQVAYGVLAGETWIPPHLLTEVLDSYSQHAQRLDSDHRVLSALTRREREILDAMTDGSSRAEIARRFYLSPNTIRSHVQSILRKLGVNSALAAVAIARRAAQAEEELYGPADVREVTPLADPRAHANS